MQVNTVDVKIDEMNLYDYIFGTFERFCDLSEGRIISLNFFLNNINAKFVNIAEFKSVFEVSSFEDIMRVLTDMDRLEELHNYGKMCEEAAEKERNSIVPSNKNLRKAPQE